MNMAQSQFRDPHHFASTYQAEELPAGNAMVTGRGYIRNLAVPSEHRGKGHGTNIMQQIVQDADRLGKPLSLHARPELHGWYKKFGFRVKGEDAFGHVLERNPVS